MENGLHSVDRGGPAPLVESPLAGMLANATASCSETYSLTPHPDSSNDHQAVLNFEPGDGILRTQANQGESLSSRLRSLSISPTRADLEAEERAQCANGPVLRIAFEETSQSSEHDLLDTFVFDTIRPLTDNGALIVGHPPPGLQATPMPRSTPDSVYLDDKEGEPLSPRSAEQAATRRRHQNQDALKRFIKIVEGNSGRPVNSTANMVQIERKSPGKLVVDQSLPVPKLFEVKRKVFSIKDNGGASTY